ncbi:MAG: hypothetical protein IGQ88_13080 [Gloeomargaritaceae cyanobacterium C42_A2020_066]|nr:hypothetical protein [Gloeomargaritaceae cyanobacterium C42_A2020_066]
MTFAMKQTLLAVAVGAGCVGMVMDVRPAVAATLTWTLSGFNFADGTTAVGSFDYDADTNTYSNINITVSNPIPANGVPGYVYGTFTDSDFIGGSSTALLLGPNENLFDQSFGSPLTNAGGTIGVTASYGNLDIVDIRNTTGTISTVGATPVPAPPGVLGLLLSGALAAHKARKSRSDAALAGSNKDVVK